MSNALLMYNVSFDHKSTAQYMILLVMRLRMSFQCLSR